jgi:hypothetical protein
MGSGILCPHLSDLNATTPGYTSLSAAVTHRRADALNALDPADWALLSLSVIRGLDDARIAQLTGVTVEAVRARRERIVAAVAAQLEILPDAVPAALQAEAEPHRLAPPPTPTPPPPPALGTDGPGPSPAVPLDRPRRRSRRPWVIAVSLLALIALGVVILVTDGGSSRHRASQIPRARAPRTTPTRVHPPVPAPRRRDSLRPLPGGPRRASGTLTLSRRHGKLTLDVRVSFLPTLHRGHYAAFLYDSILRSRPLGAVKPHGLTRLRLPADAARFREIDISDQPRGVVNPSGESRLRGSNPARGYARGPRRGSRSSAPSTR